MARAFVVVLLTAVVCAFVIATVSASSIPIRPTTRNATIDTTSTSNHTQSFEESAKFGQNGHFLTTSNTTTKTDGVSIHYQSISNDNDSGNPSIPDPMSPYGSQSESSPYDISITWSPPSDENMIGALFWRFYLYSSSFHDESIDDFTAALVTVTSPTESQLANPSSLITRVPDAILTVIGVSWSNGATILDDLDGTDGWVQQRSGATSVTLRLPPNFTNPSEYPLRVVMIPSIATNLDGSKIADLIRVVPPISSVNPTETLCESNPTQCSTWDPLASCNDNTGTCQCSGNNVFMASYDESIHRCVDDAPLDHYFTQDALSDLSQALPCPPRLEPFPYLPSGCYTEDMAVVNTTRTTMLYFKNIDPSLNTYNQRFFTTLNRELSVALGTVSAIQDVNIGPDDVFFFADNGQFRSYLVSMGAEDLWRYDLICRETITTAPLSRGHGNKWTYDAVQFTLSLSCPTPSSNVVAGDLIYNQQANYVKYRFKYLQDKLNTLFQVTGTLSFLQNVPLFNTLQSNHIIGGVTTMVKFFEPWNPLSHSLTTSTFNPSAPMLTTYCESYETNPTIGPCPSPRVHKTSKFWSPETTTKTKTLKPICIDLNNRQYPATTNTWCASASWYPYYPLVTTMSVSTQSNTQSISLTNLALFDLQAEANDSQEQPMSILLPGNILLVKWDYTGPQGNSVAIYIEGVRLDDTTAALASTSVSKIDPNSRWLARTVPAIAKYAIIVLPFDLVSLDTRDDKVKLSAVLVQDVNVKTTSTQVLSLKVYDIDSRCDSCGTKHCDRTRYGAPCDGIDPMFPIDYNVIDLFNSLAKCPSQCDDTNPYGHTCITSVANSITPPSCRCADGWSGKLCTTYDSCQANAKCNGRGYLPGTVTPPNTTPVTCGNQCTCTTGGWGGSTCGVCNVAKLGCVTAGTNSTETAKGCTGCVCQDGYGGSQCQFRAFYATLTFTAKTPNGNVMASATDVDVAGGKDDDQNYINNNGNNTNNNNNITKHNYLSRLSTTSLKLTTSTTNTNRDDQNNDKTIQLSEQIIIDLEHIFETLAIEGGGGGRLTETMKTTLVNSLALTLGLDPSNVVIARVTTTAASANMVSSTLVTLDDQRGDDNNNNDNNNNNVTQTTFKPTATTTTTTTNITFTVTSTNPTPGAPTTSTSSNTGDGLSIGDLYGSWDGIKDTVNNTPIGTDTSSLGNVITQDAYDPLCTDTDGTCPKGDNPLSTPIISHDGSNKASASGIIIAVVVSVVVVSIVVVIAVLIGYSHKHQIWCFAPSPQGKNGDGSSIHYRSRSGTSTEMSQATNLSHSNGEFSLTQESASYKSSRRGTYTGDMSSDQHKQKTIDLEPCPLEDEDLPEDWLRWKHKGTDEIFYVNSKTMVSQRHAPGTASTQKGKWF